MIPVLVLSVVALTREGNLDVVFVLEADDVLAALSDEGRMVPMRDLQNLRSLVGLVW